MSVRVVARIRPLLKSELDKDTIVEAASADPNKACTIVKIPNPKNAAETYSFNFNSVYGQEATQQDIFDNEVSPTVKHLFSGFDVTLFAYGVTGTGKTHTMRGGKTLAERGVIPRLLSSVYRKGRKIEKDSEGEKRVEVSMSYYEIYNDRVFDLFEPPEKRTPAGLPIRDCNGKTIVAGLTERPCTTLKDFEQLYDQANVNRSTSATKLNAHSSRSHAILCVKVSQIFQDHTITSTASAIDLAGSEDNRRTENGKERLVESSSINKSLFVLAQCVEAIGKKQSRIPYRESKMTRIPCLGQNNGLTIMILNLAPTRSYHLDTLSSLNLANRTRKIEVREVENEPIFKGLSGKQTGSTLSGISTQRQPLRPIPTATNIGIGALSSMQAKDKPVKAFSVFAEKSQPVRTSGTSMKRPSDSSFTGTARAPKAIRTNADLTKRSLTKPSEPALSRAGIEELVNRMVDERLASKAMEHSPAKPTAALPPELQKRLEALEQRIESKEDERAEGLQYLLMAKQHQVRGEDASALRMYRLALPFFPNNEKLASKMLNLQNKLGEGRREQNIETESYRPMYQEHDVSDDEYQEEYVADEDDTAELDFRSAAPRPRAKAKRTKFAIFHDASGTQTGEMTPRTEHLLRVINTRDLAQIRQLKGVGAKKAEAIVNALCEIDGDLTISGLDMLGESKGVGARSIETMRRGLTADV